MSYCGIAYLNSSNTSYILLKLSYYYLIYYNSVGILSMYSLNSTNFYISLGFVFIFNLISSYFYIIFLHNFLAFLAINNYNPLAVELYLDANF